MMLSQLLPKITTETSDDEWRVAEIQGRMLYVKVRILTVVDAHGRFLASSVTPFAIVVADANGTQVIQLPEGEYATDSAASP